MPPAPENNIGLFPTAKPSDFFVFLEARSAAEKLKSTLKWGLPEPGKLEKVLLLYCCGRCSATGSVDQQSTQNTLATGSGSARSAAEKLKSTLNWGSRSPANLGKVLLLHSCGLVACLSNFAQILSSSVIFRQILLNHVKNCLLYKHMPNVVKCCQILSSVFKNCVENFIEFCHKLYQTLSNFVKRCQPLSKALSKALSNFVQFRQMLSSFVKRCQILSNFVGLCQKLCQVSSNVVKFCRMLSIFVKCCQALSSFV